MDTYSNGVNTVESDFSSVVDSVVSVPGEAEGTQGSNTTVYSTRSGHNDSQRPLLVNGHPAVYKAGSGGISNRSRNLMFAYIFVCELFINYDSGAVPAALLELGSDFDLDYFQQGWLGGLVYLGLSLSCIPAGPVLLKYSPRLVCTLAMLANTCFCWLFALAPNWMALYIGRFGVGMSQAFLVIYFPIWVDEFAPEHSRAGWMSYLQGSVALGVMLGYVAAGTILRYTDWDWRPPFIIQSAILIPLTIGFKFLPKRILNIDFSESPEGMQTRKSKVPSLVAGLAEASHSEGIIKRVVKLVRSRVYICTVLGMSALYFVVTGIQFWITSYLVKEIGVGKGRVVLAFAIASATGPTLGVVIGGIITDRVGGYKGTNAIKNSCQLCFTFCITAATFAAFAGFFQNFYMVIIFIWFTLFFGGAIIPPATGVLISAVGDDVRSFSSAFSMLAFNMLGYFISPVLSGHVSNEYGLTWGFRFVLLWSGVGVIFLFAAMLFSMRRVFLRKRDSQKVLRSKDTPYAGDALTVEHSAASDTTRAARGPYRSAQPLGEGEDDQVLMTM